MEFLHTTLSTQKITNRALSKGVYPQIKRLANYGLWPEEWPHGSHGFSVKLRIWYHISYCKIIIKKWNTQDQFFFSFSFHYLSDSSISFLNFPVYIRILPECFLFWCAFISLNLISDKSMTDWTDLSPVFWKTVSNCQNRKRTALGSFMNCSIFYN